MTATVDLECKTVRAAIRDVVEPWRGRGRGLGLAASLRAELGRESHRRWAGARADSHGAESEVPVTLRRRIDGFDVELRGRVDLLVDTGDTLEVTEIKSLPLAGAELDTLTLEQIPDFALQARLYGLALAEAPGRRPLRVYLLLDALLDDHLRTIELDPDVTGTERALAAAVATLVAEARERAARERRRATAADSLRFPFIAYRPYQQELTASLVEGLRGGRPVLVQAPTGIGKTVAALSATLPVALAGGGRVLFATARNTQQQLVAETFARIIAASGPAASDLRAVILRAKATACPTGRLVCHPDHCRWVDRFAERAAPVLEALLAGGPVIAAEQVMAAGQGAQLCPHELNVRLAAQAELVLGDVNYAFEPSVSAAAGFVDRRTVVVIDEAHQLVERARGYYSTFVARRLAETVAERLAHGDYDDPGSGPGPGVGLSKRVERLLADLRARLRRAIDEVGRDGSAAIEGRAPCLLRPADWARLAHDAGRLLIALALRDQRLGRVATADPLADLAQRVITLHELVASEEAELIGYVASARAPGGAGVGVCCVDPSRRLERQQRRFAGTVAMSATVSPTEHYAEQLGLARLDPLIHSAPSPFPRERRRVLIVPTIDTTHRRRDAHLPAIARLIEEVIRARRGRYVVYLPSFAFLARVRAALSLPEAELLVQHPNMSAAERRDLLAALRHEPPPRLLLAVLGGIFAEGIDLPGDALIGAVVVGPGLPELGFERHLMRWYFNERDAGFDQRPDRPDPGFCRAMLYPGMQKVVQAAGRVIRTADDRGVILLVGRRFSEPPYVDCLPADWYERSPEELVTAAPAKALARFWGEQVAPPARRLPKPRHFN